MKICYFVNISNVVTDGQIFMECDAYVFFYCHGMWVRTFQYSCCFHHLLSWCLFSGVSATKSVITCHSVCVNVWCFFSPQGSSVCSSFREAPGVWTVGRVPPCFLPPITCVYQVHHRAECPQPSRDITDSRIPPWCNLSCRDRSVNTHTTDGIQIFLCLLWLAEMFFV